MTAPIAPISASIMPGMKEYTTEILDQNFNLISDFTSQVHKFATQMKDYVDFNEGNVLYVEDFVHHMSKSVGLLNNRVTKLNKRMDRKALVTSMLVGFTVTSVLVLKKKVEDAEKRIHNLEKLALIENGIKPAEANDSKRN